jgi:hypothetical protein
LERPGLDLVEAFLAPRVQLRELFELLSLRLPPLTDFGPDETNTSSSGASGAR